MIHTVTIDLSSRNVVLPRDRVGMVVAQPYLSLTETEPYRCADEIKEKQLEVLARTLEISRLATHGAGKTHFTIFPEYTICGLEGVDRVQSALEAANWPPGTIVLGGTDALSKGEFLTLCEAGNTPPTEQQPVADSDDAKEMRTGGERASPEKWKRIRKRASELATLEDKKTSGVKEKHLRRAKRELLGLQTMPDSDDPASRK